MKIGLHAAMLERRFPNPVDALVQAAALGADSYEIDLGIGRPGETWAARAEVFRQLVPTLRETAARVGLELSSLCLGTLWQTSLASADPGERMQGVRLIRDVCALAQPLGASVLLLPIGQPPGVEPAAARANAVMSLRECLAAAEDTDVTLALENVCQPLLSKAEELLEVITDLDSSRCEIYYDLGNPGFIGRDPVAELRLVAPNLGRVHAKDTVNVRRERPPLPETPITGDFFVWQRRTTVTLGTGEVDLAAALRSCAKSATRRASSSRCRSPRKARRTAAGTIWRPRGASSGRSAARKKSTGKGTPRKVHRWSRLDKA